MLRFAVIAAIGALSAVDAAHGLMAQAAAPVAASAQASGQIPGQTYVLRGPVALDDAPAGGTAGQAQVLKSADGHYWAEGVVDGTKVRFLVDTGATTVTLTGEDARRLGIDPRTLAFDTPVHTASGQARAARVHLVSLSVGGARVRNVDAMVVRNGLPASLLGMSYLGRLSGFEATPRALILKP